MVADVMLLDDVDAADFDETAPATAAAALTSATAHDADGDVDGNAPATAAVGSACDDDDDDDDESSANGRHSVVSVNARQIAEKKERGDAPHCGQSSSCVS